MTSKTLNFKGFRYKKTSYGGNFGIRIFAYIRH